MTITMQSDRSSAALAYVLADSILAPLGERARAWNLVNQAELPPGTTTRRINKRVRKGRAGAGAEGVAYTSLTNLSLGTAVDLTPTKYLSRAQVTEEALKRIQQGATTAQLYEAIQSGDAARLLELASGDVQQLYQELVAKAEYEVISEFASATQSVGTTNTSLTVSDLLAALAIQDLRDVENDDYVFSLDGRQISNIRNSLLSLGAASSSVWAQQADASIVNRTRDDGTGAQLPIFNRPVFKMDRSANPFANGTTDVIGALMSRGDGATGAAGSTRGAIEFCADGPPQLYAEYAAASGIVDIVAKWTFDVALHTDEHIVKIISKAAA